MDERHESKSRSADHEQPPSRPSAHLLAFEALYEFDLAHHPPRRVLHRLAEEQGADERCVQAAEEIVAGVMAARASLDATISRLAPAWPLAQMSAIDRNILRLGLFDLGRAVTEGQIRTAVNTAVELARRYGGESSPRFVRGVLGRAADLRKPADTSRDPNPPGPEPRTLQGGEEGRR
jgi:N utilization substance protein B